MSIELINVLASIIVAVLGMILKQYLDLKKEIDILKLTLTKNYATVDSIKELAQAQKEMLSQMMDIKLDLTRFIAMGAKDENTKQK